MYNMHMYMYMYVLAKHKRHALHVKNIAALACSCACPPAAVPFPLAMRQRGRPAAPEVFIRLDFIEPFLKACSPGALITAHQTCKAWSVVATRNRNVLWRKHVLHCWPAPWLQSDSQEDCDWLERYKVLSQEPQSRSEPVVAQDHHAVLKELQGLYEFFVTARSAEMQMVEGDEGRSNWVAGEFVFSLPLELRMETLLVEMGDMGGGRDTPDGLVLATVPTEPPICLPLQKFGEYHLHLTLDLTIHVKHTKDRSIAQMLTLRGCDFYHEGDGYYHWEVPHSSRVPPWLKCLTHGAPNAGTGGSDTFEPLLHLDNHENDDEDIADEAEGMGDGSENSPIRSSTMKFEFKRRTVASMSVDHYPGYGVADYCIPMCVCDMPDVLKTLTWS